MIIKKYIGANIKEALIKVERELGKEAVIISQRAVRQGGFKGLFSPKVIEITAAVESKTENVDTISFGNSFVVPPKVEEYKSNDSEIKKEVEEMKTILSAYLSANSNKNESIEKNSKENTEKEEVNFIKEVIDSLGDLDISKTVTKDIEEKIKECEETFKDKNEVMAKVREFFKEIISISIEDVRGRIALVGPTGVGKTTTIAKLAGNLALVKKKKVGLVTVDTYRIGAVEQLRTYAEIMNIKFKVVFSIGEMEEAIESMKDCDVILIDTTGRSSKNTMQVLELKAFVEKAKVNNSYLVVSATTKGKDMDTIAEGFSKINCNGIIITKLDETSSYGSIVNVCNKTRIPIKFITFGQNVPEDMRVPSQEEIIDLVLGEKDLC